MSEKENDLSGNIASIFARITDVNGTITNLIKELYGQNVQYKKLLQETSKEITVLREKLKVYESKKVPESNNKKA